MAYHFYSYITSGSYFVYKGIRYGRGTKFRFKPSYYQRVGKKFKLCGLNYGPKIEFIDISIRNGKYIWHCGGEYYEDIVPNRDIYAIVYPYYYFKPRELVKRRLLDGTWGKYIGWKTGVYIFCLLMSLVCYQWYIIWIFGTYIYLRTSYIALSNPNIKE